jgi:outer membrane protein assembly factor BamB
VLSESTSDVIESTRTGPYRPAFAKDLAYIATSGGKLYAFNPTTCATDGSICQPTWTWLSPSGALTDPVIADNKLFVGSEQGTLYAFALKN